MLRFFRSLVELNYVSYDRNSKCDLLSPCVMSFGFVSLSEIDLGEVAIPFMEQPLKVADQSVRQKRLGKGDMEAGGLREKMASNCVQLASLIGGGE